MKNLAKKDKTNEYNKLFLVTYKRLGHKDLATTESYYYALAKLEQFGVVLDYTLEEDSHGKLHLHCIWQCRLKNPYFKKFVLPGYNFDCTGIYDVEGAVRYIHKHDKGDKDTDTDRLNTVLEAAHRAGLMHREPEGPVI